MNSFHSFVDMFFIKNVFIELALKLLELSLKKSYWIFAIVTFVKNFIKIKCVKKHLLYPNAASLLTNGSLQISIVVGRYFYAFFIRLNELKNNFGRFLVVIYLPILFEWIEVRADLHRLFPEKLLGRYTFWNYFRILLPH